MPLQHREKPHGVWINQGKDNVLIHILSYTSHSTQLHAHTYTQKHTQEWAKTNPCSPVPAPTPVCATQVTAAPHPRPDSMAMPLTLCLCPSPSFHPSYPLPKSPHLNTFRMQGVAGGLQVCRLHYLHAKVCWGGRNGNQWGFRPSWELLIKQRKGIGSSYSQPPAQSRIPSGQRPWQTAGPQLESGSYFQYTAHETAGHNCQRPAGLRERVSSLGPVKKGQERSWGYMSVSAACHLALTACPPPPMPPTTYL